MSDKEWFSGLTFDDVIGKHVRIEMKDHSIIEGRLNSENGAVVTCDGGLVVFEPSMSVFFPYQLNAKIESTSLLWDERDWEQIPFEDADEGDTLVIGESKNEIFEVHGKKSTDRWWTINNDENSCITPDMVSYVLRKKLKLPTEPGYYRGADGTLLTLIDSSKEHWMYISGGSLMAGTNLNNEDVEKYLPLTPVHFVEGKE